MFFPFLHNLNFKNKWIKTMKTNKNNERDNLAP
jgi:hypothetical protein